MQPVDVLLLIKSVPLSAYPLFAIAAVGLTAVVLSFTRRWRLGLVLLGSGLVILWIAATPAFANWVSWRLESEFPAGSVEALPRSDAVILLGGADPNLESQTNEITQALRLYRAGKAPIIVISGGNQLFPNQTIADHLILFGVLPSAVIVETKSRNTRENAVNAATIFKARGWRNGLLVTSALHMPRAIAAFKKVGLGVVPAAASIQTPSPKFGSRLELRTDEKALLRTTVAIKEMIGLLVYRWLGWA